MHGDLNILPPAPRNQIEYLRIKDSARACLYSISEYYKNINNIEDRIDCLKALTHIDKIHFNQFAFLGEIFKELGDKESARKYIEEALAICERDNASNREFISKLISTLKKSLKEVQ